MNYQTLRKFSYLAVLGCLPMLSVANTAKAKAAPTVFFVQSANQALVTPTELILQQPQSQISWFADAPSKANGTMPMVHYYDLLWGNPNAHFNQHHPNASLVGEVIDPKTHQAHTVNMIINLDQAQIGNKQIRYHICNLMKQGSLTDLQKPLVLQHPTLFIDRYICPTCD